jgi:glycosyltransferase involved in cell wall biosynthesis
MAVLTASVCICTLNRAEALQETLRSLAAMRIPPDLSWDVIVVDNGSNDTTPEVVRSFQLALPVRCLNESRRGLAIARNTAVRNAAGDLIIWTDDDVRVDPGWLEAYANAARERPEDTFFGGPINPHFVGTPPAWLTKGQGAVGPAFAQRGPRADGSPLRSGNRPTDDLPYGANFAVRGAAQRARPFREDLGWVGAGGLVGEETELLESLLAMGHTGSWVAGARIQHMIPPDRQTLEYLRSYYFRRGAAEAKRLLEQPEERPLLFGLPRYAIRSLLENEARFWLTRYTRTPKTWLRHLRTAALARGLLTHWAKYANRSRPA